MLRPRIAVIGSGISGLAAAYELSAHASVSVFEANAYAGGHANTVDVDLEGQRFGVDTGFLVYNERTYPRLIALFEALNVPVAKSDMSFSVKHAEQGLEWSGSSLNTVFAQRRNLLNPRFYRMLRELLRFNALAGTLAQAQPHSSAALADSTIGEFLDAQAFSEDFRQWYFLPMIACIWSCPLDQMLQYPLRTLLRFCHNHGLLQVSNRPQWFTVQGGSREYVHRVVAKLNDVRLSTPVLRIQREVDGKLCHVSTARDTETFDHVVLATHTDQALKLLADTSQAERNLLGAIAYQPNLAVLHTDTSVLPKSRRAWAAWNYERGGQGRKRYVSLHYLINQLQPLPVKTPVIVSLNPIGEINPSKVIQSFDYEHPVFDGPAIQAQAQLPALQGQRNTWYCGAWTGYGFHEDGLRSGQDLARQLIAQHLGHSADIPLNSVASHDLTALSPTARERVRLS
jgi:predicted NAD/FAD-binding protein